MISENVKNKHFKNLSSQTLRTLSYLNWTCLLKTVLQNVMNIISQAYSHREFIDSSILVDNIEYGVVIGEVWFIIHCPSE